MRSDSANSLDPAVARETLVARLLRRATFEEPRVVSFDIDSLAPKASMAFAGNTYA